MVCIRFQKNRIFDRRQPNYRGDEKTCVDIDECAENTHNCSDGNVTYENLQARFRCLYGDEYFQDKIFNTSPETLKAMSALMGTTVQEDLTIFIPLPLVVMKLAA